MTHVDEFGSLADSAESGFESVRRELVTPFAMSTLDLVTRRLVETLF
jgi:hypothetical protein